MESTNFFFYKYQIYSATLHRESADGFFFFFRADEKTTIYLWDVSFRITL